MKPVRALIIAALALLALGCQRAAAPPVKSMEVQYTARPDYPEKYNFRYDSDGRLTAIERTTEYDGEKVVSSWKYEYSKEALAASCKTTLWGATRTAQTTFRDDFTHMTSFVIPQDADNESDMVFLGQKWEASYSDGRLIKAVFTDLTSDGIDSGSLTWEKDLLVKFEGSDPSVFVELKDFEYSDTPNPFEKVDPSAFLLGINHHYWEGLAGLRPDRLISGYTRITSDPWVEDMTIDHIGITYETDLDNRISHILQTVNGILETVIIISY
ncbi:MAG: hypothetical protein J6X39_00370 [Bacteroidales bacterium]|nr:hypothetical protein [Bacteroidales bacterium]